MPVASSMGVGRGHGLRRSSSSKSPGVLALEPGVGPKPGGRRTDADHDVARVPAGGEPALQDQRALEAAAPHATEDRVDAASAPRHQARVVEPAARRRAVPVAQLPAHADGARGAPTRPPRSACGSSRRLTVAFSGTTVSRSGSALAAAAADERRSRRPAQRLRRSRSARPAARPAGPRWRPPQSARQSSGAGVGSRRGRPRCSGGARSPPPRPHASRRPDLSSRSSFMALLSWLRAPRRAWTFGQTRSSTPPACGRASRAIPRRPPEPDPLRPRPRRRRSRGPPGSPHSAHSQFWTWDSSTVCSRAESRCRAQIVTEAGVGPSPSTASRARTVVAQTRCNAPRPRQLLDLARLRLAGDHGDVDQIAQARQRPVCPGVRGKQQRMVRRRAARERPRGPVWLVRPQPRSARSPAAASR